MEALSRWVCSFVAEKVLACRQAQTVTCGETALLCCIHLTNFNSRFTNYHENKIAVSYRGNNTEVTGRDYKFQIEVENSRQLNVYCNFRRAGKATVKLDLGKWYIIEGGKYSKLFRAIERAQRKSLYFEKTEMVTFINVIRQATLAKYPVNFMFAFWTFRLYMA